MGKPPARFKGSFSGAAYWHFVCFINGLRQGFARPPRVRKRICGEKTQKISFPRSMTARQPYRFMSDGDATINTISVVRAGPHRYRICLNPGTRRNSAPAAKLAAMAAAQAVTNNASGGQASGRIARVIATSTGG